MSEGSARFLGTIPDLYDRHLGPECEELFAFIVRRDKKRFVGSFRYDAEKATFSLHTTCGNEEEVELIRAAVAHLSLVPTGQTTP